MGKEFGYTIEDVDKQLVNYINKFNITVPLQEMNVRLKASVETPDEAYSRRAVPMITVHSGFLINIADEWKVPEEIEQVDAVTGKNRYLTQRLCNMYYTYRISYLVSDPRHASKLDMIFGLIFPKYFELRFEEDENKYCISFVVDPAVRLKDDIVDGIKYYRKDYLLRTMFTFEWVYAHEYLQAQGVEFEKIINLT